LEAAHIVLTVRADTLGRHGGQISLPGGVVDPGETFEQAAIREAHEEIALAPDDVVPLGALTPLDIPVSGFRLHPIVATTRRRPSFRAADGEVAAILEIDLDELANPSALVEQSRERDGVPMVVPGFHVRGVEIWGATGMVLAEFLTLLGWPRPNR
jgi:8-oxo-dGTP pyrophosphatase MutT (NUDIX family)